MQIRKTNMEQWRGLYNGAWNAVVNNNVQTRPDGGGSMSIKERFFRNKLNLEFSYDDLMKLNDRLPENMKWSEVTSTLHQHHTVDGKDNIKYVSADGHFEIVYNGNNETQNQYNNPDDIRRIIITLPPQK